MERREGDAASEGPRQAVGFGLGWSARWFLAVYAAIGYALAFPLAALAQDGDGGINVGVVCFCFLAWIAIAVGLGVWVYKDANARGENGALWLLILIVGGIIGLIIWLIVRSGKPRQY
jgi:hypothetical protein